jgi:type IV pilus assembly protein PilB
MSLINSKKRKLEEKLSRLKREEEENKAKGLAEELGLPYVDLFLLPISSDDIAVLPEEKARKGKMAVIKKAGRSLKIAVNNPRLAKTARLIEELKQNGFGCQLYIASLSGLRRAWQHYRFISRLSKEAPLRGVFVIKNEELKEFKKTLKTINQLKKAISDISTTRLLTIILAGAVEMSASDIHLEPTREKIRLRYRIDGLLQDITDFPPKVYQFLLSRIKTLSDLLLNVHDVSQDGRFSVRIKDNDKIIQTIDIRVSILPSNQGESIVMRLLGISIAKLNLEQLGISKESFEILKEQISRPNGIVLNTGPTGSGKTTTLYACLKYVNKPGMKIITVEDPIEYQLPGITQTQIDKRKGRTFAAALRSVVRQDPDILMIGEIRDEESAAIAIQFALTGHLVFSTLHTNSAAGAIPRLISLKALPESMASSINLIIAQRLVRRLCPDCKKEYRPPKEIIKSIKKILSDIPLKTKSKPLKISKLYQPAGCLKCHGLGYQGRIGVFEFLVASEPIKKLIINKAAGFEIEKEAKKQGMITLVQDGLLKVVEGITSLEEAERVLGKIKQ